ncbi:alpha/beta hydrolase fold domain-containing protein [Telluria sp. Tellsp104]
MPAPSLYDTYARTIRIELADDERERERALRARFAEFWSSAGGDLRATYDTFIATCPLADGCTVEQVAEDRVGGWWVRPAAAPAGQAILYLHGGGYVLGSAAAYRGFASQIASRTGLAVLAIDYPLAPEATLPAAPNAALAAWRWLRAHGIDHVAIAGDSAGGGLALAALSDIGRVGTGPAPVAGVVFSPWTDLAFTGRSMTDPAIEDPLIGHDYLRDCAAKVLGAADPYHPLASPLFADKRRLPPLLIQVGTDERLLDDARAYAGLAAAARVPVTLEIWEGMHHVFQLDVAHLESSRHALDRAADFLRRAFAARHTPIDTATI